MLEQEPGEQVPQTQRAIGVPAEAHATGVSGPDDLPEWVEAQYSRLDLLLCALVPPEALARLLLQELAPLVGAARGAIYTLAVDAAQGVRAGEGQSLALAGSYAAGGGLSASVRPGEGLVGQCALEQRKRVIVNVPEEHWRSHSALGSDVPRKLVLLPVWLGEATLAVIELGFAGALPASRDALLGRLCERRPAVATAAVATAAVATAAVAGPASHAEARAPVVGVGQGSLSSHRSGFWGKLSHELRSPLNSVLVLSKLLSDNLESNLTAKQVAFARAIHASGNDLLGLVNAISDLSKIESNRLVLEPTKMSFDHFRAHLERAFEPIARGRGLEFDVELDPGLPDAIVTDAKRLRQIMKCLLSNAFKFTERGRVSVRVTMRGAGWLPKSERSSEARSAVAFAVVDTGVGMSESELCSILDVFPPERIESRRGSGASGLGMAISRELARLLGGELRVESVVGSGSTFTLYLPVCLRESAGVELSPESDRARQPPSEVGDTAEDDGDSRVAVPAPESSPRTPAGRDVEPGSRRGKVRGKRREGAEAPKPTQLSGFNIMLVDDDVRSAFALTGLLERQGADVSHAEDVGEALERLGDGLCASALLIDAELLTAGSEDSVRHMLQRCERLPIIALTRIPRPGGPAQKKPAMPPQVYQLEKPVDAGQLVSVLLSVASQARSLQSGPVQS